MVVTHGNMLDFEAAEIVLYKASIPVIVRKDHDHDEWKKLVRRFLNVRAADAAPETAMSHVEQQMQSILYDL